MSTIDIMRPDTVAIERSINMQFAWLASAQNEIYGNALERKITRDALINQVLKNWLAEHAPELETSLKARKEVERCAVEQAKEILENAKFFPFFAGTEERQ